MKNILSLPLLIIVLLMGRHTFSQTGGAVNVGLPTKSPSIFIEKIHLVDSSDVARIPSLSLNLIVFNTNASMIGGDGPGLYYYNGHKWVYLVSPANPQPSGYGMAKAANDNPPPTVLVHGPKTSTVKFSNADHDHNDATDLARCRCVR